MQTVRNDDCPSRISILGIWGVFLAHSLLIAPIPGAGEPHYLSKARWFVDHTWCESDFFLQSSNAHFVFYVLTGWLTTWLPFPVLALLGRCISLAILASGWRRLGCALQFTGARTIVAAVLFCLVAAFGNLSGEWIVGGFESKVPAYGLALCGTSTWLCTSGITRTRRDRLQIGCWIGGATALHPVIGLWFLIAIGMAECGLMVCGSATVRTLLRDASWSGPIMAVTAAPGVIPALQFIFDPSVTPEDRDIGNYLQVFERLNHHLDPTTFPPRAWLHTLVLLGICAVVIFIRRRSVATGDGIAARASIHAASGRLALLLAMSTIIALTGVLIGWHTVPAVEIPDWRWRVGLLKYYPFRLFDGLLPITTSFLAAAISGRQRTVGRVKSSLVPLLLMLASGVAGWRSWYVGQLPPSGFSTEELVEWREACTWIRTHTDSHVLVLTPRESFAFKWYAERAEYVCYKDCPQDATGLILWNNRLWWLKEWMDRYLQDGTVSAEELSRLHRDTGIDLILTRHTAQYDAQPVHSNSTWQVYSIAGGPPE